MLRRIPRRLALAGAVVLVLAALVVWRLATVGATHHSTQDVTVASQAPAGDVTLDARLYVPDGVDADHPAPAIMLAHGFGGTKDSVSGDARRLADRGYVVLTWSARGFGRSTGSIGLDSLDGEVVDARNLVTWLAERPEVSDDGDDDPRVAIVGESYGGALALMTAGTDPRVDTIVPQITWNRLSRVLFPNGGGTPQDGGPAAPADADDTPGAFKREWAGIFFSAGKGLDLSSLLTGGTPLGVTPDPTQLICGRFTSEVCQTYTKAAASGTLDDAGRELLDRSSPYAVAGDITAPTLLVQGETDTLFPLSEADVTAAQLQAAGTPVTVRWVSGGHDSGDLVSGDAAQDALDDEIDAWLDHWLKDEGPTPATDFTFDQAGGLSTGSRATTRSLQAPAYPLGGDAGEPATTSVPLAGGAQPVVRPAGGTPASLTSLPGLGTTLGALAFDPPGQVAVFSTRALEQPLELVGSPRVRITVSGASGGSTLFAKVYDASPDGRPQLPGGQVVPVTIPVGAGPTEVDVVLPALSHRFESGHRMVVALASTDRAYAVPTTQQVLQVGLAEPSVTVPSVPAEATAAPLSDWFRLAAVVAALALLAVLVGLLLRRRRTTRTVAEADPELADVPLRIEGLAKSYADGFTAVRQVDLTVEREQVVGLLGPNGAGKTTTLRMLMGLIRPSAGDISVFGHPVRAGSPVLSRVGCFVEGTGFLPHLSGRDNLELYWAATGRPEADARFEQVLEVAALGSAVDRRVRTYSQGMRQRLAIAQAMLGLPDLLVLDEPTNGLDPPQIAEMRAVLRSYAVDGRSVLVSSHQLGEVEATCTHVVVMARGEVLSSGTVEQVTASVPEGSRHRLEDAFLTMIGDRTEVGS